MKKVFIVMAIAAFLFAAANSYACGNKSSAESSKASATTTDAKIKTADAGCASGSATQTGAQNCTDAKAANAGAENCPMMKDATAKHADAKGEGSESCPYMKDGSAQKAGASGCCSGSKAATTKASSVSTETKSQDELVSKDSKDNSPVLLISSPAQGGGSSK
jgi:hypothetical protein